MHPNPDLERIRFAQTIRCALAQFAGERLVFHVRSLYPDWSLAVTLKFDGTSVFTVGRGLPRGAGPAPIRVDALAWDRPRLFHFWPRSRHALIAWLEAEVHQHNNEVSTHD